MLKKKMMTRFRNSVIHSIVDGHGVLTGWLFTILAGRVRLCYTDLDSDWDYDELNRVEPVMYFITGKPDG